MVGAVAALEQGRLWHKGNFLDFPVQQVVQVALDQALLRMAAIGARTSFRFLSSQSTQFLESGLIDILGCNALSACSGGLS